MRKRSLTLGILFAAALCAADDLPKAETILDKYVEATGGKAAYAKVKSDITNGTMTLGAMGVTGKVTIYSVAPDMRLVEIALEGVGKVLEGSDGNIAWSFSAMQGPRLKDGDEKAQALLLSRHNMDLHWRDLFKTVETAGTETVEGKDCYKVVLTPNVGKPITRWYDRKTNLLVKMAMTSTSPMGEMAVESLAGDYRKEGELTVPHKLVNKVAGQEFTMTIDAVQHNPEIPKDKFDPPAEVKALINKPTAK